VSLALKLAVAKIAVFSHAVDNRGGVVGGYEEDLAMLFSHMVDTLHGLLANAQCIFYSSV
jgi:hypothetical protein